MDDFRSESSFGERLKSLRKQRGIRSTNDLADLTQGAVSAWTLQNLESGRKNDLSVSALLNLCMALKVAPVLLLAPMIRSGSHLDLVGLTEAFDSMSAAEFDAWFSGLPDGATRPALAADRSERNELQTLRELSALLRERRRLSAMLSLEAEETATSDHASFPLSNSTAKRLAEAGKHIDELSEDLTDAGWVLDHG